MGLARLLRRVGGRLGFLAIRRVLGEGSCEDKLSSGRYSESEWLCFGRLGLGRGSFLGTWERFWGCLDLEMICFRLNFSCELSSDTKMLSSLCISRLLKMALSF